MVAFPNQVRELGNSGSEDTISACWLHDRSAGGEKDPVDPYRDLLYLSAGAVREERGVDPSAQRLTPELTNRIKERGGSRPRQVSPLNSGEQPPRIEVQLPEMGTKMDVLNYLGRESEGGPKKSSECEVRELR